ncbi:hypothetical protein TRVA0_004S03796 [Trichomonascus vanleenenianus]|uniref:uncharacterized protein n=1 Tax=Trichomonascus vanleenenianus TaxID=2268995 RepID=UPI003ECB1DC6
MKSPFLAGESGSELYNPKVRKGSNPNSVWSARLSRNSSSGSLVEESVRRLQGQQATGNQLTGRSSLAKLPKSVPDLLELPKSNEKVGDRGATAGSGSIISSSSTYLDQESTNLTILSYPITDFLDTNSTLSISSANEPDEQNASDASKENASKEVTAPKIEEDEGQVSPQNEQEEGKEELIVVKVKEVHSITRPSNTCSAGSAEIDSLAPDSVAGENPTSGHTITAPAAAVGNQTADNTQVDSCTTSRERLVKEIYSREGDAPAVNEISPNSAANRNQDSLRDKSASLNETESLHSTNSTVCNDDYHAEDARNTSTGEKNHSPRAPESLPAAMLNEPVSQIHQQEDDSPLDRRRYHTPSQSVSTNCSSSSMSTVYSAFSGTSGATKPESPGESGAYSPVATADMSTPLGSNTHNDSTITNEDTIQSPSDVVENELAERMANLDVLPLELTGGNEISAGAIPRTPSQPNINSFRTEDIPPEPQYSPPRVPVDEVMSHQSILEAFDNDIRDLLSTEGYTSMFTNMKFQNEDLIFQDSSSKSSVAPTATASYSAANRSPQQQHNKSQSTASSISFSNYVINSPRRSRILEEMDSAAGNEDPAELDPCRHRVNHSTSTNNSMNLRNSRSTLSSYGMSDAVELDPEDPRTRSAFQSPKSLTSSPRHKSFGSSSSIGSNWGRPRSISARLEQPAPASLPPMPPFTPSATTTSDDSKNTSTITSTVLPKQLSRMNSDVEHRVKRGRLSLRRKSAATLRLSSLSLHTHHPPATSTSSGSISPVKDNSTPPTPSMQLFTATYESFLSPNDTAATKAVFPTDQEQISLWFLRQVLASKSNPAGAFLTSSFYLANDLWHVDTISPKLLEPRLKCINDLTKIGADHLHQTNTYYLKNALDALETQFNSAFINGLGQSSSTPELGQRRSSSSSVSNALTPTASQSTQSTTSSHKSVFKRLRKKSTIGADSPPTSEPPTPLSAEFQRLTLANYLSAISSLANALQSVQQHFNETQCGGEWLMIYRTFIAHVACRLILKDLSAVQDVYKSDFREYLLSR